MFSEDAEIEDHCWYVPGPYTEDYRLNQCDKKIVLKN
jgi:hypothetical protein